MYSLKVIGLFWLSGYVYFRFGYVTFCDERRKNLWFKEIEAFSFCIICIFSNKEKRALQFIIS